jgi:Ni/Co efflux regulator RcnB
MKSLVSAALLALTIAAPAFAQTQTQTTNQQATAYMQQAERLESRADALPGGGDEKTRNNLEWRALVAKANAIRVGGGDTSTAQTRSAGSLN